MVNGPSVETSVDRSVCLHGCPLPVNAAAATLAVYTFRFLEVSLVYLPAPPRLRGEYGKLRW
jgi:hypothetical protein